MKINTDKKRIDSIFNRGIVVEILPTRERLFERLLSGERLKIYIGADPTSDSLHLSHAKNYMFLEELRQLGHEVVILIGDFTAQIGDPTGRADTRTQLTDKKVRENVKGWVSQIKPLMEFHDKENPPKIVYNSKWLSKLSMKDVISLAAQFTVQQMIERDMFKKRWQKNIPIYLHEFIYPLLHGYDSVALGVDVELCGVDQTFNALAGRTLVKRLQGKEKFIIAVNLMANPKTGELMSKSKGTGVFLSSPPGEMYGAIMNQPDEMIEILFINCTRIPLSEKDNIMALGPRNAKARVAFEIVRKLYGDGKARLAEKEFNRTFRDGGFPEDVQTIEFIKGRPLSDIILESGAVSSNSEFRRLLRAGALEFNQKVISDSGFIPNGAGTLRIGKKRFLRIEPK